MNSGSRLDTFAFTNGKQCMNSMHMQDFVSGFGHHNYGCTLNFMIGNEKKSLLITWDEVLQGQKVGIKVWRLGQQFRDVYSNFGVRSKTDHGLMASLDLLCYKIFGDRLQAMHLINCYYRATIKIQNKQVRQNNESIVQLKPVVLEGVAYNQLIDECNDVFGRAIINATRIL